MLPSKIFFATLLSLVFVSVGVASDSVETYGPYPVTVKGYSGDKTDSTSYTGQMARHVLQTSLKKLAGSGNGEANPDLHAQMSAYYAGKDEGRSILSPKSKDGFPIKQSAVDEISKGKNLKGKTYKGAVTGWPGNMTGAEVTEFWIGKASGTSKGFDPLTGLDYGQLISKFLMGAVFYNQAVDNYLDELLEADKKPNDKPYKEGKQYTGKEHAWDEAFGYFGAPAHALALDANQAYGISKRKPELLETADHNGDGVVDLYREMTYGHAYYAADADKSGTNYLHTITQAFIDGRKLLTTADGAALTDAQRAQLKEIAGVIKSEWEKVIAEAAFKYAGSVYKDLQKLNTVVETGGDSAKIYRDYGKHWGELKGFAMALQTSGRSLGETGVRLDRLVGYSPLLLGGSQISGIDSDGNYTMANTGMELGDYMVNMIKVQQVLDSHFGLAAKKNDATGALEDLMHELTESKGAESD